MIDYKNDPHQTTNLAAQPSQHTNYTIANRNLPQILSRLDALMMVLKSCAEDQCRHPWNQLHPKGKVNNLPEALHPSFDHFYANQPKVSFSICEIGYLISAEGPQEYNRYGGGKARRDADLFWEYESMG